MNVEQFFNKLFKEKSYIEPFKAITKSGKIITIKSRIIEGYDEKFLIIEEDKQFGNQYRKDGTCGCEYYYLNGEKYDDSNDIIAIPEKGIFNKNELFLLKMAVEKVLTEAEDALDFCRSIYE